MAQVPVQQTVFVEVNTENTGLHQFRHASELTKEAKGGYLSGTIRICGLQEGIKIREITLSLVQDKEGCIHPGVLHVTPTERKERKSVKSTKKADNQGMRAEDFQVKLIFEDPGMIFVQTSYLKDRARLDVSDCWNSETRTLDLDHDKLQLTVVKPKQKSQPKPDDDLFIINVLKNKYKAKFGTTDDVAMAKLASEFTSGRGGNGGRETTLFKVFLSATCLVSDCQTPYIGICPKPIYDKGKYELKIKDILPPIICNEMGHKISIVFEKTTGDVPVVFRLLDENHDVVAEAVVKEKSGNVVKIGFDEILPLGCFLLDVTIQEGLDIIPASNQTFWVQVLQHQETNCYPCKCVEMNRNSDPQVANGNRGKRKNDASGCVDPKRRFSSVSRHASSPSNASPLSSDDNRSPNAYQEGNGQFTTSPYQGSPDSGLSLSHSGSQGYDFENSPQASENLGTTQDYNFSQLLGQICQPLPFHIQSQLQSALANQNSPQIELLDQSLPEFEHVDNNLSQIPHEVFNTSRSYPPTSTQAGQEIQNFSPENGLDWQTSPDDELNLPEIGLETDELDLDQLLDAVSEDALNDACEFATNDLDSAAAMMDEDGDPMWSQLSASSSNMVDPSPINYFKTNSVNLVTVLPSSSSVSSQSSDIETEPRQFSSLVLEPQAKMSIAHPQMPDIPRSAARMVTGLDSEPQSRLQVVDMSSFYVRPAQAEAEMFRAEPKRAEIPASNVMNADCQSRHLVAQMKFDRQSPSAGSLRTVRKVPFAGVQMVPRRTECRSFVASSKLHTKESDIRTHNVVYQESAVAKDLVVNYGEDQMGLVDFGGNWPDLDTDGSRVESISVTPRFRSLKRTGSAVKMGHYIKPVVEVKPGILRKSEISTRSIETTSIWKKLAYFLCVAVPITAVLFERFYF